MAEKENKQLQIHSIGDRVRIRAANRELHMSSLSQRRLDKIDEHESENEHSQKDSRPIGEGGNRRLRSVKILGLRRKPVPKERP